MTRISSLVAALLLCGFAAPDVAGQPSPVIPVQGVFLRLSEDVDVPAREAGVLAEVPAGEGALIRKGDLLGRIEDDEVRLIRDRAALDVEVARREADRRIELEYAQKALAVTQSELARAERSREAVAGAVSLTEVDRLRLEMEKAAAEIRRIEHEQETGEVSHKLKESELALADLRLKRHSIVAPISGRVVEHYKDPGEWVEPGERVLRVVRLDVLRAEGYLDASAVTDDLVGMPVRLTVGSSEGELEEYAGHVVFVAPEVEPTTGQVLIRAEIENPDLSLRPGLRAELLIVPPGAAPLATPSEIPDADEPPTPKPSTLKPPADEPAAPEADSVPVDSPDDGDIE